MAEVFELIVSFAEYELKGNYKGTVCICRK